MVSTADTDRSFIASSQASCHRDVLQERHSHARFECQVSRDFHISLCLQLFEFESTSMKCLRKLSCHLANRWFNGRVGAWQDCAGCWQTIHGSARDWAGWCTGMFQELPRGVSAWANQSSLQTHSVVSWRLMPIQTFYSGYNLLSVSGQWGFRRCILADKPCWGCFVRCRKPGGRLRWNNCRSFCQWQAHQTYEGGDDSTTDPSTCL